MASKASCARSESPIEIQNEAPTSGPPERIPPPWGKPLTESDYATLAKSWITREIADAAMLRRVEDFEGREIVGQKSRNCAGIIFTY